MRSKRERGSLEEGADDVRVVWEAAQGAVDALFEDFEVRWALARERALALEARLPEALVARARLAYLQKQYDEAIRYSRAAMDRKHDCPGAYNVLGRALFASDRWQEAAGLVDKALKANGDDYNMYIAYILVLESLGETAAARGLREREMNVSCTSSSN